jgi:sodium-dependent phosphate transporter
MSWVLTLAVVGLGVAALFAQGVFAPSKPDGLAVAAYEQDLSYLSGNMTSNLNATLLKYEPAARAGALKTLNAAKWDALNQTVSAVGAAAVKQATQPTLKQSEVMDTLRQALQLQQANSVLTLGQDSIYPGAPVCNGWSLLGIKDQVKLACPAPKLVPAA